MGFAIVILCIAIGCLTIEKIIVSRSVTSLKTRIHVNGTRGKSSVTEYIASGLREESSNVMSKVTGIVPTVNHNGIDQVLGRSGVARVQEQFSIIKQATRKGVESLVLECMSISPDLQHLESRIFKPHVYVITNIKDDHREVMGQSVEDQAAAICRAIPENCRVVTSEKRFINQIISVSEKKNSTVIVPQSLGNEVVSKLPHGVFPENVALAIAACEAAGIDPGKAKEGVLNSALRSVTPVIPIRSGEKEITFLNAFSVNDVDSASLYLEYWKEKLEYSDSFSILFNTRADRPLRTDQFANWMGNIASSVEHIFISGNHAGRAKAVLKKRGFSLQRMHYCKGVHIKSLSETLLSTLSDRSLVVGIGNIGGDGIPIIKSLS